MQLSKQEIIVLRETFLFHHMSEATYVDFCSRPQPDYLRGHFPAGQAVAPPQDQEHCIAIVISGLLLAAREPRFPDMQLREGFVIGAMDLFSSLAQERPPITAVTDSDLLFITASQMRQLFDTYPEIMMRYINFLTGQIHTLKWEHTLATTSSGERRLLQFLSLHMEHAGGQHRVTLPYSFSVLAGRLNMSRASLYRAFDHLEESGLLQRQGKTLVILKPELLSSDNCV